MVSYGTTSAVAIEMHSLKPCERKLIFSTSYQLFSDVNFVEYFIKGKNTKSIQLTQVGAYFPKEEMNFSDSVEITGSISSEEFSGNTLYYLFIYLFLI